MRWRQGHQPDQPALITNALLSPEAEFASRRKRYAIMMSLRVVCVVLAAATYRVSVVLALLFIVGGAVLPWCAVLIANDGPPKKRTIAPRIAPPPTERVLPTGRDDRIVDG